jgi:hypothetical protein
MTVTINAFPINGLLPHVDILDATGTVVPAQVLVNGAGTLTLQAAQISPGANYYLQIAAASEAERTGNFTVIVDFNQPATSLDTFVSGTLSGTALQKDAVLYVAEDQLFHFALSANALAAPDAAVHMTITDSSGAVVFDLVSPTGGAASGSVFLAPGAYTVHFTAVTGNPALLTALSFTLDGAVLSDPIGPLLVDPTLKPLYTSPNYPGQYVYPGGYLSTQPFFFVALVH